MMLTIVNLVLILFIMPGSMLVKLQRLLDFNKVKNHVTNKLNGEIPYVYSVRDSDEQGLAFLV